MDDAGERKIPLENTYFTIGVFAKRAGVSVRTLQYYDSIGLLTPSKYSEAGRRLYCNDDVVTLQQIVTLKYIGLSLYEIKTLITMDAIELPQMLRQQKRILKEKIRQMKHVIHAIEVAEQVAETGTSMDLERFVDIIKEVNMSKESNWLDQFLTQDQQQTVQAQMGTLSEQKQQGEAWKQLFEDIQAYLSHEPDKTQEQILIDRWESLIYVTVGDDQRLQENVEEAYAQLTMHMAVANFPEEVREWLQKMQDASDFIKRSR